MWLIFHLACTFVTDSEWAARNPDCETAGKFLDLDGDGYGNQPARTCAEAAEAITTSGDCNDADATVNPAAIEVFYDGLDQNCDDADDYDADGDGSAAEAYGGRDCMDAPTDEVPAANGDCTAPTFTPAAADVHPGATDTPYDGVDSDCSGGTDFDADKDGYATCQGDCEDTDRTISPAEAEVWYDGTDDDCDGNDADADGDGYALEGYMFATELLPGDCDDTTDQVFPGAADPPYDGVDADCAGNDDDDLDGDGVDGPSGIGPDCDDGDAEISPALVERCDTPFDDDCDGLTDAVNATDCTDWYVDGDRDGLGAGSAICTCQPSGTRDAIQNTDCDDRDAAVTIPVWYLDGDADGFGVPSATTTACAPPAGYAATNDDCDDADDQVYPDATESCDAVDSDCDGSFNDPDALIGCTDFYRDADGDASAGADVSQCLCVAEGVWTFSTATDCDDGDPAVSPSAPEVCNDLTDDDCDGGPGGCSLAGSFTTDDAGVSWAGATPDDRVGSSIFPGGDLDGDGLDEVLVRTPGYATAGGEGLLSVLRPVADGTLPVDAGRFSVANSSADLDFATAVATPGDLDGDGNADLLFASTDTTGGYGELRGYSAIRSGYTAATTADVVITAYSEDYTLGGPVVVLDDVDFDGVAELVYGSPDVGTGNVIFLPADVSGSLFAESYANHSFGANSAGDALGSTLLAADVDGDGAEDLVIGAPGADRGGQDDGAVFVFAGGSAPWSYSADNADLIVDGGVDSRAIGAVTPCAADLDDDGTPDLVVPSAATGGGVWTLPGSLTGADLDLDSYSSAHLSDSGSEFASAVAAGDVDGDGRAELLVGAPSGTGAAWLFAGPLAAGALTTADASASFVPTSANGLGRFLALLNDTDGDGYGDLALAAPLDDGSAGGVWLFAGGGY